MSKRSQTGKDHYSLALDQYKRRDFISAVQSIDKAISFGYRDYVVYDVKAAALSKLAMEGETVYRDQAMELIADMCKRWGKTDTRPWVRRAEYLRSMGFYKGALGAMDEALAVVNDDTKRQSLVTKRNEIAGEREKAQLEQDRRLATASKEEKDVIMIRKRKEAKSTQNFIRLISDDILLLITDHLLADDPNIACRLSAVCTEWRDTLYDRPYLWSNLVLGNRRPTLKAAKFVLRNKGNLKRLTLLPSFKPVNEAKVSDIVEPHIERLEYFSFANRPDTLIAKLKGRFNSLKEIVHSTLHGDSRGSGEGEGTGPDRGMMLAEPTLQSLVITGHGLQFPGYLHQLIRYDSPNEPPTAQRIDCLANLAILNCRRGWILCPEDLLETLCKNAPLLQEIEFDGCAVARNFFVNRNASHNNPSETGDDTRVTPLLEHLVSYLERSTYRQTLPDDPTLFSRVRVPRLVRLELSKIHPGLDPLRDQLRAVGLADALPNLQHLDISHSVRPADIDELMKIFADMPSLRFLNVSYTPFGDDLLRALTWVDRRDVPEQVTDPNLLPELVALSVAGLEITSIVLRDFVISRLPKSRQEVPVISKPQVRGSSAFRPSGSTQRSQPVASGSGTSSQPVQSTQTEPDTSSGVSTKSWGQIRHARFKWLCLDHVKTVDPQLSIYLASKLPFVSHSLSDQVVPERIKAKGRYSWDLDYYHSCVDPSENKCTVQRVQGTLDRYQLVHKCGRHDTPYDESEMEVLAEENIWCSQYNPESTQRPRVPNPSPADPVNETLGDNLTELVEQTQPVAGSSHDTTSSGKDLKRIVPSTDPGPGSSKKIKSSKGKGKMKISIGDNGFLSGF